MSVLRPWRAYAGRKYAGNFFGKADAMKAVGRLPSVTAVIVDESTARRLVRRGGEWLEDGFDLKIAARLRAKAETSFPNGEAA